MTALEAPSVTLTFGGRAPELVLSSFTDTEIKPSSETAVWALGMVIHVRPELLLFDQIFIELCRLPSCAQKLLSGAVPYSQWKLASDVKMQILRGQTPSLPSVFGWRRSSYKEKLRDIAPNAGAGCQGSADC